MGFSILQSWILELTSKHMRRKNVTSFYLNNESDFGVCHTMGKQLSPVSFGEIGEAECLHHILTDPVFSQPIFSQINNKLINKSLQVKSSAI